MTGEQARPPGALPAPPTALIGREREVAEVAALLSRPACRLVTLVGPGGAGKTRVALAAAASLHGRFAAGVAFVDLSPLADRALVLPAVARALGVEEPTLGGLAATLAGREVLLVLDNFEQVLAAARDVADLLAACPGLAVLATSRSALRLSGEQEFPIAPLPVPELRPLPGLRALSGNAAVALFVQRAQAARPDFRLTEANAPDVAELCVRLDGLPLAIELAAAWTRLLSPAALRERMGARLALLVGGPRDRPSRQQTLRAALDWSYALLPAEAQALFRTLGVFVGGFGLDAVAAVAGGLGLEVDPLTDVAALADASLVRAQKAGRPRFGMLETVREYAQERLEAAGEADAAAREHAAYFLTVAEGTAPALRGPQQAVWLERLEREHDNLRAALSWAVEQADAEMTARLGTALWRFWWARGHLAEGRRWLEAMLARSRALSAGVRARTLSGLGLLASQTLGGEQQGDRERARAFFAESLALSREQGDARGVATAIQSLAQLALQQGELDAAIPLLEESLALFRRLGDREHAASALNSLGFAALLRGDGERAAGLIEASLALRRELGDRAAEAASLASLGRAALEQRDFARARTLLAESLAQARALGLAPGTADALESLASLAAAQGRPRRAARLLGAAEAARAALGAAPPAWQRVASEQLHATLAAALGAAAFEAGRAEGAQLSGERAIAEALAPGGPAPGAAAASAAGPLSEREREVAALVAAGLTNRQIGAELVLAEGTVKRHLSNILEKLDLESRAQLAVWAVAHGLLAPRSE